MSDIKIIIGIVGLFLVLGAIIPYIDTEYGTNTDMSTTDLEASLNDDAENVNAVSIIDVFFSIFLMFFWTFGALPLWLELIMLMLRITLLITVARNVWVGGGG